MSAPDFIWADKKGQWWAGGATQGMPRYVRRDLAVIAELPEVKALIAAALQQVVDVCDLAEHDAEERNWRDGAKQARSFSRFASALIPTDHAAALEAVKAQEWNRALEWACQQTAFMPEAIPKSPRAAVHKALDKCEAAIRAGKVQP